MARYAIALFLFCFVSVEAKSIKIWDTAKHSAFTDLILYHNKFFCTFRESDSHAGGEDGKIRVIASPDGKEWKTLALIAVPGVDLRDPSFSVDPQGRLMLSMGGKQKSNVIYTYITRTYNGKNWAPLCPLLKMPNEWIWDIAWFNGKAYGFSYRLTDPQNVEEPWELTLFESNDGVKFKPLKEFSFENYPSEARIRFTRDGKMVALLRLYNEGKLGFSFPPYLNWEWVDLDGHFGGPNFIIDDRERIWICSRRIDNKGPYVALGRVIKGKFVEFDRFPSGGDTGYPGMVYQNGTIYISYYSSHEEKSKIYFTLFKIVK